jgi:uncharacterized protein (TIGR03435 family)
MKTARLAPVLLGIAPVIVTAQSPAFEVASIKAVSPREGAAGFTSMDTDPAMVRYSNVTLKLLMAIAYRFDGRLIQGGPSWLDEQPYDLTAKIPPGTSKDRVPAMLQTLLVERLHLATHRETKEQRGYFLVAGPKGNKLIAGQKVDQKDLEQVRGAHPAAQIVRGGIMGHSMTMGSLAGSLSQVLGSQVEDHTGLGGTFDIDLKWTPDDGKESGPSLFTALQEQLGLKLEPGKVSVQVLVVDHADRNPNEN